MAPASFASFGANRESSDQVGWALGGHINPSQLCSHVVLQCRFSHLSHLSSDYEPIPILSHNLTDHCSRTATSFTS